MNTYNIDIFSNLFIKPNIILYFRLQVFHMLERDIDGEGGLSTIVDGFKVAEILKKENPLHFKNLTDIEIESEYIEPGIHYKCIGPVIKIDATTKEVYQIR